MTRKSYLILEDGLELEGTGFGHESETIGEIVFNTSMSGYQEILTDPSYNSQIITMTYPMIGNYGINGDDTESAKIQVSGFVVKEYSKVYSNFRATMSLGDYLEKNGIPAIEGIDTRRVTRYIRDKGAMRAGIFPDRKGALDKVLAFPKMEGSNLVDNVTCREPYDFGGKKHGAPFVAAFDFGIKTNILRLLTSTGFNVRVYPGDMPLAKVMKDGPSGIFLSNGPGDPDAVESGKQLVQDAVKEKIPTFGICLGHQLIALALGARTYKLKFGHRGANQPVKNLLTGKIEITSQNHGFAVDYDTMKSNPDVEITHVNLNDKTVEGLRHKKLPIMSVQYHPEASPGPHDSRYLFTEFYRMITR